MITFPRSQSQGQGRRNGGQEVQRTAVRSVQTFIWETEMLERIDYQLSRQFNNEFLLTKSRQRLVGWFLL